MTVEDGRCVMSVQIDPKAEALYEKYGRNFKAYAEEYRQANTCFTATEIPYCVEGEGFTGNIRTVLYIYQTESCGNLPHVRKRFVASIFTKTRAFFLFRI